ncbi:MAG: fatty acid desaturase [Saprospiraceae bacterium]|jgi:fatty acid desaturase
MASNNKKRSQTIKAQPVMEWQTLLLALFSYSLWIVILLLFAQLPALVFMSVLCLQMVLFSSLSHEVIHGHPFKATWLNDALVSLPLTLYPYYEYKQSHLTHHIDENLTIPNADPESFFVTQEKWANSGAFRKMLKWIDMTLLGRFLFGPASHILHLAKKMLTQLMAKNNRLRLQWLSYLLGVAVVLWIVNLAGISLWLYAICAYFALSIIGVRSFYEHRPMPKASNRIVVVRSCAPFHILFLYNNLHAVHHKHPTMPWYHLFAEYQRGERAYLENNGGFYFAGYRHWLKYLIKPVAHPVHPGFSNIERT